MNIYKQLKKKFKQILNENGIQDTSIRIRTKVLSTREAIGNPIHDDYPLIKGRERLIMAEFMGSKGVAFTDLYGDYDGMLYEITNMELKNNFTRAIFISTLNSVLRNIGLIDGTEHCKDDGLLKCAEDLKKYITDNYSGSNILLVGHQPRFSEVLTENFNSRIVDMDTENTGKVINGVQIETEDRTDVLIAWADLLFVTGSTFVNATAEKFILPGKETVFYGVTGAGPTYLLGLKRYCTRAT